MRVLSTTEMKTLHGSGPYRNAYFAGTLPWHRSLRDANLCNGNLFKSFTDIQVAPGRANVSGCLSKDDPNCFSHSLATLTDDQGRRIDVYLDQSGRCWESLSNQAFSGATLTSYTDTLYTFDNLHLWLTQLSNTFNSKNAQQQWTSKLLVQNNYTLDNAGQRLTNQISSLDPATGNPTSRTEQYGYDELNRLTSVDYGDGQTQGYTFDQMGNRLTKTDSSTGNESYAANAANMLTSRTVGGTTSAYTNDADGNTLTGGGRTNTWDSQNRMAKCVNGTNISTFTYAADGIRHSSVVNGNATDFVLDANMFVRELHNGLVKATYFMGASGPAYRRDDGNGSTVRWYLYDGLGSVLGEVDPNGNITARRKYDVYGLTRAGSDAGTSKHKFVGQLGHPSEDETGLTYMQARYYDPQTGRFENEDSALAGHNWYIYCNNNPINYIDASGKDPAKVKYLLSKLSAQLGTVGAGGMLLIGNLFAAGAFFAAYYGIKDKNVGIAGTAFGMTVMAVMFYAVGFGATVDAIARDVAGGSFAGGLIAMVVCATAAGGKTDAAIVAGFSMGLAAPVTGGSFVYALQLIAAMID